MKRVYTLIVAMLLGLTGATAQVSIDNVDADSGKKEFENNLRLQDVDADYYSDAAYRAERRAIRQERNTVDFSANLHGSLTAFSESWQAAGDNAITVLANLNFLHTYKKGRFTLTNTAMAKFGYNNMKMSEYNGDDYPIENAFYKACFKPEHTIKVGAEYRVTNALSLRAGYALQLSPIKAELKEVNTEVPTAGMQTAYILPGNGSYYSCGAGYKFKSCYIDLAYQHYAQKSDMFAYSPIFSQDAQLIPSSSEVKSKQNSMTFTFGLKF